MNVPTYSSGNASLFAVMARTMGDISVICPYCFSEDVTEIDHEYGIEYCNNCQTRFERPCTSSGNAADRQRGGDIP